MAEKQNPPQKEPSRFKINLNPDQLRRLLQSGDKEGKSLFAEVSRHSRDYQDALGLGEDDIKAMESLQGRRPIQPEPDDSLEAALLKLSVDGQQFGIFAQATACHAYGNFDATEAWQDLLVAIGEDPSLNKSVGGGTTWINAVPEDWHQKILEAIRTSASNDDLSQELFNRVKK